MDARVSELEGGLRLSRAAEPWCRITHTRKSCVVATEQGVSRRLRRIGVRTRSWFFVVKDAERQGPPRRVRGGPWAIEQVYMDVPARSEYQIHASQPSPRGGWCALRNSSPTTWRRVGGSCPEGPARGFSIISVSAAESTAIHASSDRPAIGDRSSKLGTFSVGGDRPSVLRQGSSDFSYSLLLFITVYY